MVFRVTREYFVAMGKPLAYPTEAAWFTRSVFRREDETAAVINTHVGKKVTRRRTTSKTQRINLTPEETKTAAQRMMAGAQAHQRASVWCADKPDAKPPNIDWFFFNVVSLELILMSIEQSLRLLLLLHYSIVRDDTNHTPHVLYKAMQNKSGAKDGIRSEIVKHVNLLRTQQNLGEISEEEIVSCLRKHNASYGTSDISS